jgi:hypothetical protein
MEKPKMGSIFDIEAMEFLEPSKKGPPPTGKLRTNFNPHAFNSCIAS